MPSRFAQQFASAADAFLGVFGETWLAPDGTTEFAAILELPENTLETAEANANQRVAGPISWKEGALATLPTVRQQLTRDDGSVWTIDSAPHTEDGWVTCRIVLRTMVKHGGL